MLEAGVMVCVQLVLVTVKAEVVVRKVVSLGGGVKVGVEFPRWGWQVGWRRRSPRAFNAPTPYVSITPHLTTTSQVGGQPLQPPQSPQQLPCHRHPPQG